MPISALRPQVAASGGILEISKRRYINNSSPKSEAEIFLLRDENDKVSSGILYVRNLSSTVKLEGVELSKFIKSRISKRRFSKMENEAEQAV